LLKGEISGLEISQENLFFFFLSLKATFLRHMTHLKIESSWANSKQIQHLSTSKNHATKRVALPESILVLEIL
jgi:hypothetical protein